MKKIVKTTSLMLSTVLVCALGVDTGYSVINAKADSSNDKSVQLLTTGTEKNSSELVFVGDTSNQLSKEQIKDFQKLAMAVRFNLSDMSTDFDDPAIAKELEINMDKRGKAGLTAKAAAKVLKAALKKMGKKGYTKLAKTTGLQAVGLNWSMINKVADVLAGWGGKLESGIKSALKKCGFNSYWAGVTARLIVTVFF